MKPNIDIMSIGRCVVSVIAKAHGLVKQLGEGNSMFSRITAAKVKEGIRVNLNQPLLQGACYNAISDFMEQFNALSDMIERGVDGKASVEKNTKAILESKSSADEFFECA